MDSWAKSTRDSPWAGVIPNNAYMAVLSETVKQLIVRGARITVAANPERPSQIVGWACIEPGRDGERVVHAIYTKRPFRRMKVASQLLASAGLQPDDPFPYTYRTLMSRVFPNAKYFPAIARRQKI